MTGTIMLFVVFILAPATIGAACVWRGAHPRRQVRKVIESVNAARREVPVYDWHETDTWWHE